MSEKVYVKILREGAVPPVRATEGAAGADLCACIGSRWRIAPGQTVLVPTGIALELPENTVGLICARSGMAVKRGLAPANKVGVIDSDYRGEILVALYNQSGEEQVVEPRERIAQLVVTPYILTEFVSKEELSDTRRGEGGFGSTGTK